jgi:hypothetical protein
MPEKIPKIFSERCKLGRQHTVDRLCRESDG